MCPASTSEAIRTGTTKTCPRCGERNLFDRNQRRKDGLAVWCRRCMKAYRQGRKTEPRAAAIAAWHRLKNRATNRSGQHPTYTNVELRMTREEFVRWAEPRIAEWLITNTSRWSIDRIDSDGHYAIDNLQLASLGDNSRRKSNNKNPSAPPGRAWCSRCEDFRDRDEFHKARARSNGLRQYCKNCVIKMKKKD